MDDTMEARIERVRHHLRRPLAGRRQPIMKTASYTLNEIVPIQRRILNTKTRDFLIDF
jgi:hypothetical protein